jgi:hypothetical protein
VGLRWRRQRGKKHKEMWEKLRDQNQKEHNQREGERGKKHRGKSLRVKKTTYEVLGEPMFHFHLLITIAVNFHSLVVGFVVLDQCVFESIYLQTIANSS